MSFCSNCGKEILEGTAFCGACGTPVEEKTTPPATDTAPNFSDGINEEALIKEEQEFLDTTHDLLRWERKSWSIFSKFYMIFGIIYGALFALVGFVGLIMAISGEVEGIALVLMGFLYAILFGGMFIVLGVVHKKVADKMPIYLDSLYNDFSITNDRSGNVGMLVFAIIFGGVHTVFFIINFVRLKAGGNVISRILARQGKN